MNRCTLVVVLCTWLLTSCNAAAGAITYWHCNSGYGGTGSLATTEFSRQTGITVKVTTLSCTELRQKYSLALAQGSAPDVALVHSDWSAALGDRGAFVDLNAYVRAEKSGLWQDIPPAINTLWRNFKGELYGIGADFDVEVLFYNPGVFNGSGVALPNNYTWEQALTSARKLTYDTNGDSYAEFFGITNWWFNWHPIVWAYGGDFINLNRTGSALNSTEARAALALYRQFFTYHVFPTADDWNRAQLPHAAALWQKGKVAMAPANLFGSASTATADSLASVATELPMAPSTRRSTTLQGNGWVVANSSRERDAAYKFIVYLQSEFTPQHMPLSAVPARSSLWHYVRSNRDQAETLSVAQKAVAYARTYQKGYDFQNGILPVLNTVLNTYFSGMPSLEQTLAQVEREVSKKLAQDVVITAGRK